MKPVYIKSLYTKSVMEVGEGVECNPLDEKGSESQQWYLTDFKGDEFTIISKKNGMALALEVKDKKQVKLVELDVRDSSQRWKRHDQCIVISTYSSIESIQMLCVKDKKICGTLPVFDDQHTFFQMQYIVTKSYL